MKKLPFLLCVLIFTSHCTSQTTSDKLDTLISAYFHQNSFSGSVLVVQKGMILINKGYGYKNKKDGTLNDSNTIFQIGSITKQFTSTIILQLVEKHELLLQDKLSKYISDYPHGDSITIENLLTHTSGVFNYTNDPDFMQNYSEHPISRDSLIARFKYKPLDFEPGSKWSYSNSGYILLGAIIEKVTGKSYFSVVHENIFQPLGMSHSGFDFTDLKTKDKATGYLNGSSQPAGIVDSSVSFAAGAIYTTTGDLYKWDRALYTDRVVTQASLQKAFTPYQSSYGYGWGISYAYGKKNVGHGGGITGFVSFISRVPDDEICIILLSNWPSAELPKIAGDINNLLNGKSPDLPVAKKEININVDTLKTYTGDYELTPAFHIFITLDGDTLSAQATGQGKNPLFAEKVNLFFLKVVDAQIEFFKGSDGKTDHLVLYQNGQKVEGKKIN
jgi:CubicO group peptidase (beta-lactamase class C family)